MSLPPIDDRGMELTPDHRARLAAIARREGLGAEDARDAVQEAYATLLRLDRAQPCTTCERGALLTTLVINAARNMRRRHHRARPHLSVETVEALSDPRPLPEQLVVAAETGEQIRGCMATLGEVPRRIVSLRLIEDVSGEEVAKLLELKAGHVAVLLHRAKKELSSCLRATEAKEGSPWRPRVI
jgi:RNA polymerase sigma-70 factor (ECF subfamily)